MRSAFRFALAVLLWFGTLVPAQASVVITFWSQDMGKYFPHAFFTLRGVPDTGGPPVDVNYGFTAKSISPAILFGSVPGRLDIADPAYMNGSDAQFEAVLTDAQYAAILHLIGEWGDGGDSHYNLNKRNCVSFVAEAAHRAGLVGEFPKLIKKPHSFLLAMAAANPGRAIMIGRHGDEYLPTLSSTRWLALLSAPPPPLPVVTGSAVASAQGAEAWSGTATGSTSSTAGSPALAR